MKQIKSLIINGLVAIVLSLTEPAFPQERIKELQDGKKKIIITTQNYSLEKKFKTEKGELISKISVNDGSPISVGFVNKDLERKVIKRMTVETEAGKGWHLHTQTYQPDSAGKFVNIPEKETHLFTEEPPKYLKEKLESRGGTVTVNPEAKKLFNYYQSKQLPITPSNYADQPYILQPKGKTIMKIQEPGQTEKIATSSKPVLVNPRVPNNSVISGGIEVERSAEIARASEVTRLAKMGSSVKMGTGYATRTAGLEARAARAGGGGLVKNLALGIGGFAIIEEAYKGLVDKNYTTTIGSICPELSGGIANTLRDMRKSQYDKNVEASLARQRMNQMKIEAYTKEHGKLPYVVRYENGGVVYDYTK